MKKIAIDVYYKETCAKVAGVIFQNYSDEKPEEIITTEIYNLEPYESGQFYKRELPGILKLLEKIDQNEFDSNEIIGIVIRWDKINHLWIWMGLDVLTDNIWCTNNNLEIQTTLEDPVENYEIMKKASKNLVKFPAAKCVEDFSRKHGRKYYLGSSVDYLEIQRNIKKIKTIIKKYNLKSNISFGNAFWTSSTGYDKYICGLRLDSSCVFCDCDRDNSYSVLPIGIL